MSLLPPSGRTVGPIGRQTVPHEIISGTFYHTGKNLSSLSGFVLAGDEEGGNQDAAAVFRRVLHAP